MKEIAVCFGTSATGKTTFAKTEKEYAFFSFDKNYWSGFDGFKNNLISFVEKNDKIIIDGWLLREKLTNLIKELEKKYDLRYFFYVIVRDVRVISKTYQERPAHRLIPPDIQCKMIYDCIDYVINHHGGKGVILQLVKDGYLTHSLHIARNLLNRILYCDKNEKYPENCPFLLGE